MTRRNPLLIWRNLLLKTSFFFSVQFFLMCFLACFFGLALKSWLERVRLEPKVRHVKLLSGEHLPVEKGQLCVSFLGRPDPHTFRWTASLPGEKLVANIEISGYVSSYEDSFATEGQTLRFMFDDDSERIACMFAKSEGVLHPPKFGLHREGYEIIKNYWEQLDFRYDLDQDPHCHDMSDQVVLLEISLSDAVRARLTPQQQAIWSDPIFKLTYHKATTN